jgi:hypothetical protein
VIKLTYCLLQKAWPFAFFFGNQINFVLHDSCADLNEDVQSKNLRKISCGGTTTTIDNHYLR